MSPTTTEDDSSTANVGRLADLDDRLAGHAPTVPGDTANATDGATDGAPPHTVTPTDVDVLLLLNAAGAEYRHQLDTTAVNSPDTLGRFTLVREVGRGGFATVHEAIDGRLHRRVALKVAHARIADAPLAARRFVREAELAARVTHPNIVTVYEVGEDGGRVFIAGEYCDGGSLAEWLEARPGPADPRTAAAIVRDIAEALHTAHGRGVVHRDVKPANIMLCAAPDGCLPSRDGRRRCDVKLGDFGLGVLSPDASTAADLSRLSRDGDRVGTLAWMAPEQVDSGIGPVGPLTDVHALGLVLERLLTGRSRQAADTDAESIRRILFDEAAMPPRASSGIPADLGAVCLKCLAKAPGDRYASAAELAVDLTRFLGGLPTIARPVSAWSRLARMVRRQPLASASLAATLLALVLGGVIAADLSATRSRSQRQQAELLRHRAAAEMRLAFDSWRNGSVLAALEHLGDARSLDAGLAGSLAGAWLEARMHGEREMLLDLAATGTGHESGAPSDIHAFATGNDGETIAVGRADGSLSLAALADGADLPAWIHLPAHDEINAVALSPDGSRVATAGQDGAVKVWSATDGSPLASLATAGPPIYAVAFSPDGSRVAHGGEDRTLRIVGSDGAGTTSAFTPFDGPSDEPPADGEIESILWIAEDRLVVACGYRVLIVNAKNGAVEREFGGLGGVVSTLDVSPGGRFLLCAGTQPEPRIFSLEDPGVAFKLPVHPGWVQGGGFSPDGKLVCTGCRDGVIRVFDAGTGGLVGMLIGHAGRTWQVRFAPDGSLLSCGADGTLRRWNPMTSPGTVGAVSMTLPLAEAADGFVAARDFIPGSATPKVILLPRSGRTAIVTPGDPSGIELAGPTISSGRQVAPSTENARVAVADHKTLTVFALSADAPPPEPIDTDVSCFTWLADGRIVVGDLSGALRVRYADGRVREIDRLAQSAAAIVACPDDGDRFAVAAGTEIGIYEVSFSGASVAPARQRLFTIPFAAAKATAIDWSPDGRSLAVGTSIGTVQTFDAATGRLERTFSNHVGRIDGLRYSRDGRILVSSDDQGVRMSDVETTVALDEIRPGWTVTTIDLAPADGESRDAGLLVIGSERPTPGTQVAFGQDPLARPRRSQAPLRHVPRPVRAAVRIAFSLRNTFFRGIRPLGPASLSHANVVLRLRFLGRHRTRRGDDLRATRPSRAIRRRRYAPFVAFLPLLQPGSPDSGAGQARSPTAWPATGVARN